MLPAWGICIMAFERVRRKRKGRGVWWLLSIFLAGLRALLWGLSSGDRCIWRTVRLHRMNSDFCILNGSEYREKSILQFDIVILRLVLGVRRNCMGCFGGPGWALW